MPKRLSKSKQFVPARTTTKFISPDGNVDEFKYLFEKSDLELSFLVERGLPTQSLEFLKQQGLTSEELNDLVINARTLKRRKANRETLSTEESDRVVRYRKMMLNAMEVFGSREKALHWLRRPNPQSEGRTPLEVAQTAVGGDYVEQMLYRIDEGVFV